MAPGVRRTSRPAIMPLKPVSSAATPIAAQSFIRWADHLSPFLPGIRPAQWTSAKFNCRFRSQNSNPRRRPELFLVAILDKVTDKDDPGISKLRSVNFGMHGARQESFNLAESSVE